MKVVTNGCFTELNSWHKKYLKEASKYGDLIVLMNSNKYIKKYKNYKIIKSDEERKQKLLNLPFVKEVYIFDESPIELFKQIKPDIYIKGGDYNINNIDKNEKKVLEELNAKIIFTKKYEKEILYNS